MIWLYDIFICLLNFFFKIAALFNPKAKDWVNGRKKFFTTIQQSTFENSKNIWMHCASVGEYEQGLPLLQKIKINYPNYKIIVTFFSPSGYNAFKKNEAVDEVYYLPLDTKKNAIKFIETIKPSLVFFVKYEFWFHYLQTLKNKNIPTFLVSGIFRNNGIFTKKIGALHRKMLSYFTYFFIQNIESLTVLQNLDFTNAIISGDTRYDRVLEISKAYFEDEKIKQFCNSKKILIAGSTWLPDEEILLSLFLKINNEFKLIIVPHEIKDENILALKNKFNGNAILYTEDENFDKKKVLIINKIGLLSKLYRKGTIAYVGGGFGAGIHNVLEAAVYNLPIIFGPKFQKFQEAKDLQLLKVAISIKNEKEIEKAIKYFLENKTNVEQAIDAHFKQNIGATNKILDFLINNNFLKIE